MQEIPSLPPSPCPYLVQSNSPPTDAQASVIHQAIQTTNDGISSLDSHIVELKKTLEQCQLRRQELVTFAHLHRGVVSSLRRVPSEVLGEIFKLVARGHVKMGSLCHLSAVCSHWRTVALSHPLLWRYICLNDFHAQKNTSRESRRISTQAQHSREAPLIVTVITYEKLAFDPRTLPLLDLLLVSSARWQRAALTLGPEHFAHISQSEAAFSRLSTLTLRVYNSFPPNASIFFKSLCALTDLTLETTAAVSIPSTSGIPWTQLRSCHLSHFSLNDIAHVLPLLPPQSSLSLRSPVTWNGPLPPSTTSLLSALSFDDCDTKFVNKLLAISTSPNLKKLAIRDRGLGRPATGRELPPILEFLLRSRCALTELALDIERDDQSSINSLVEFLESEPVCGIVDLEYKTQSLNPSILSLLAKQPQLLPELRVLALHIRTKFDDQGLLELCNVRRQALRELWIEVPRGVVRSANEATILSRLRASGLDVVVSPLFRDRHW